jgi:fatty acid-binding protein DegV
MLYDRMAAAGPIAHVAVMHSGAPDIDRFLELVVQRIPREAVRVGTLGAVIGVHGGAKIIGISWIADA